MNPEPLDKASSLPPRPRPIPKRQIVDLGLDSDDDNEVVSKKKRSGSGDTSNEASDGEKYLGGLSDHDERCGDERRFAKDSPFKGKKRINSKVSLKPLHIFPTL